jgi:Tol biopolymer transport system component
MAFDGLSEFPWRIPENTVSANGFGFIEYPSYAPDGQEVAFETGWRGPRETWVVSAVDGRVRPLVDPVSGRTHGVQPAWSPNRKWIAVARGTGGIWIVHPDGSGLKQLTSGPTLDGEPAWSPDGTQIAFTSIADMRSPRSDIWVINADGSGLRQLTKPPQSGYHPSFSPDGSQIVFSQGGSPRAIGPGCGGNRLNIMNANGTGARQLTTGDAVDAQYPSWSKRGILFVARRCASPVEIVMIQPDGANLQVIPNVTSGQPKWSPWQPTWSPDGNKFAFVRAGDSEYYTDYGIQEYNFSNGTIRALLELKGYFIAIEIMPGTSPKLVSLRETTLIRVAIPSQVQPELGSNWALHLDRTSFTFGRTGEERSLADCAEDGANLVCHFKTALTGFRPGDGQGILRFVTVYDSTRKFRLEGRGTIQIVP